MKQVFLALACSVLTLGLLSILDSTLIKQYLVPNEINVSEIHYLPPRTTAIYETPEFEYTVTTNTHGYRSDEITVEKPANGIRILAFGDSFTYGWGVEFDKIWTSLLKKELGKKYPDKTIEIYNFGIPGGTPDHWLELGSTFIPQLKPDLVLLGLTEGDDLGQLMNIKGGGNTTSTETIKKREQYLSEFSSVSNHSSLNTIGFILNYLYPNTYKYIATHKKVNIKKLWSQQTIDYLKQLDDTTMVRFEKISPDIRKLIFTSSISPALLWLALYDEDHYIKQFDTNRSDLTQAYQRLQTILTKVQVLTEKESAELLLIDIPTSVFVNVAYLDIHKSMGISTRDHTPYTSDHLIPVTQLANDLNIIWVPNLERMRKNCTTDCFFTYDGHMNAKGNKIIADSVFEYATKTIKQDN